jgi:hypothetical protein
MSNDRNTPLSPLARLAQRQARQREEAENRRGEIEREEALERAVRELADSVHLFLVQKRSAEEVAARFLACTALLSRRDDAADRLEKIDCAVLARRGFGDTDSLEWARTALRLAWQDDAANTIRREITEAAQIAPAALKGLAPVCGIVAGHVAVLPGDQVVVSANPALDEKEGRAARAPFIPTGLQEMVLGALKGKALTLDALQEKLHTNRKTVCNALKELKTEGLVKNNRRLPGYYRPDAPPPKYADKLGNSPT